MENINNYLMEKEKTFGSIYFNGEKYIFLGSQMLDFDEHTHEESYKKLAVNVSTTPDEDNCLPVGTLWFPITDETYDAWKAGEPDEFCADWFHPYRFDFYDDFFDLDLNVFY